MTRRKNLLLALDAFGTLYHPKKPIPEQYAAFASRHGITQSQWGTHDNINKSFKKAFKEESKKNPNYGRATGMGAETWWGNIITNTFRPFLRPGQEVPQVMVSELLTQFSTKEGYLLYPDVKPFFEKLRELKAQGGGNRWPWKRTIVGVITNSDARVPHVLESFDLKVGARRYGSEAAEQLESETEDEDINFVIMSYDVGFEKPDRRIFDAALQLTNGILAAENRKYTMEDFDKLYIGDSNEHDGEGARQAKWNSLLIDRELSSQTHSVIKSLEAITLPEFHAKWIDDRDNEM
ncbi:haloacid dehalogenase [Dendryphion nanum]|uniref:Haloacid dehalogenase n=1 Tax=Dendryphion nanum TaxID=256645 RepID=A0A9P9EM10_9PLEO|nr:haloacid dehalogenase [Dendryphion nanum]